MGVWYETKDVTETGVGIKEENDFLATTDLDDGLALETIHSYQTLRKHTREVALAMPKESLKDELQEKEAFRVRTQLLRKKGKVKMHVNTRDAHMYLMPHWSKDYIRRNETFESFGEDVVGWWGKARWQKGLSKKLGIDEALRPRKRRKSESGIGINVGDEAIDLGALSSTMTADLRLDDEKPRAVSGSDFASRVPQRGKDDSDTPQEKPVSLPPMLSYIHPALYVPPDASGNHPTSGSKQKQQLKASQQQTPMQPPLQLIRRVDTVKLLLSCSLYLARLPSILAALPAPPPNSVHPYCHSQQVHATSTLPSQATISTQSVLIDANCTLQPRITIRDSVIGMNCSIASGSRLRGCLLMDGVVIEERVVLSGCVLGRRCKVSSGSELKDCFLQDGYVVSEGTNAKAEVLAGFDEGTALDEEDEDEEGKGIDLGAS